jgi:hypothetical protein
MAATNLLLVVDGCPLACAVSDVVLQRGQRAPTRVQRDRVEAIRFPPDLAQARFATFVFGGLPTLRPCYEARREVPRHAQTFDREGDSWYDFFHVDCQSWGRATSGPSQHVFVVPRPRGGRSVPAPCAYGHDSPRPLFATIRQIFLANPRHASSQRQRTCSKAAPSTPVRSRIV